MATRLPGDRLRLRVSVDDSAAIGAAADDVGLHVHSFGVIRWCHMANWLCVPSKERSVP